MKIQSRIARVLSRWARNIDPYAGSVGQRTCPICGYEGYFRSYARNARADAVCPKCGSKERHRLFKLMLDRCKALDGKSRILHFAPESAISRIVRPVSSDYVTADLMRDDVDLRLDIEAMEVEDSSFDALICVHVLEHVDDVQALREMFRILRPGGLALLNVPIDYGSETTYEDPSITDGAARLLHFGQHDHLRRYGRDFRNRVESAGFSVEEFIAEPPDMVTYALVPGDRVFIARKPAAGATPD